MAESAFPPSHKDLEEIIFFLSKMVLKVYLVFLFACPNNSNEKKKRKKDWMVQKDCTWPSLDFQTAFLVFPGEFFWGGAVV